MIFVFGQNMLQKCMYAGRGRDGSYLPPPRTDPYGRNYRIRLLPRVCDAKRSLG